MDEIKLFGYASGNGAGESRCCMGPIVMQSSKFLPIEKNLSWVTHLFPNDTKRNLDAMGNITTICTKLAQHTYRAIKKDEKFIVIGGDHSGAIGTWSGVSAAKDGPIGMIWVDAHLDSHTPESSTSKNIHGMSLASLLNYGSDNLTNILSEQPKIAAKNTVVIGARDYEPAEKELLDKIGVEIIFMEEIIKNGLTKSFKKALDIASSNPNGFGLSIDVDGLEPKLAPGTSLPIPNGILPVELINELKNSIRSNSKFLGLEIAEFSPELDQEQKTEAVIAEIIKSCFDM